jgi:hypothetical protein
MNDDARAADMQVLDELLRDLNSDHRWIIEAIGELHEPTLNDLAEFIVTRSRGAPK